MIAAIHHVRWIHDTDKRSPKIEKLRELRLGIMFARERGLNMHANRIWKESKGKWGWPEKQND